MNKTHLVNNQEKKKEKEIIITADVCDIQHCNQKLPSQTVTDPFSLTLLYIFFSSFHLLHFFARALRSNISKFGVYNIYLCIGLGS